MEVGGRMLRSHNVAFCGWVNIKIYKLDMYIENDTHTLDSGCTTY